MRPGRQLGFLWGGVAFALVALSPFVPGLAGLLPACPFKSFTGLPCPGCGTTRAALALARLDLPAAFAVSPLAALGWCMLIVGGLAAGALALAGRELPVLPRPASRGQELALRATTAAALVVNWLYLVHAGS